MCHAYLYQPPQHRNTFSDASYAHCNVDTNALVTSHDALLECEVSNDEDNEDHAMQVYCFRPESDPRIKKLLHLIVG